MALEGVLAERAEALARAVAGDQHEGGLRAHLILAPDIAALIDDIREHVHARCTDEGFHCGARVESANSDEGDPWIILRYLCDRTGFSTTGRSPRRPEPQDGISALY